MSVGRVSASAWVGLVTLAAVSTFAQEQPASVASPCSELLTDELRARLEGLLELPESQKSWPTNEIVLLLTQDLHARASVVAQSGQLLMVDFRRCEGWQHGDSAGEVCSGDHNLLNTGLEGWVAGDGERDLSRWHKVAEFQGMTSVLPAHSVGDSAPAGERRLVVSCWAVRP